MMWSNYLIYSLLCVDCVFAFFRVFVMHLLFSCVCAGVAIPLIYQTIESAGYPIPTVPSPYSSAAYSVLGHEHNNQLLSNYILLFIMICLMMPIDLYIDTVTSLSSYFDTLWSSSHIISREKHIPYMRLMFSAVVLSIFIHSTGVTAVPQLPWASSFTTACSLIAIRYILF